MEFIAGIVVVETFGDYWLAQYAKSSQWWSLGAGYASYAVLISMFIKGIQDKGLAWANSAWDGWSNLTTGLMAIIVFKETPTIKELIGMILISAGVFLLGTRGTK